MTPDRLLTPAQAAAKLATTRGKVVALARGGAVPAMKLGGEWRYSEAALDAWIARSTLPLDGAAETTRERSRVGVPDPRPPKAVGRVRHRRVDARGPADPKGALRIVGARGEGHAA